MRGRLAFTLLEVVVAGGLLATGMLALVTIQSSALQVQRRVGVVRELVAAAEAELYRQLSIPAPIAGDCLSTQAGSRISSCSVEVEDCSVYATGLCAATDSVRASRVEVRVGAAEQAFALAAIHGRFE